MTERKRLGKPDTRLEPQGLRAFLRIFANEDVTRTEPICTWGQSVCREKSGQRAARGNLFRHSETSSSVFTGPEEGKEETT
ncbi:hypothetical protein EC604_28955 [Paenibacillus amylolyticus]|uniref:Uncharacterized protein n=1 Tax=Paenibacillus amylolyticus TaxID=1451 RepID=A0A5M9X1U9_PAEAM|nr:hypothetical protein [Paenibacillus amylolyticus]KAA8787856.1 hypothetical protein EC604_28955 [Paenibacillus amylolyticus]